MAERTPVEKAIWAALERAPAVNLHRWPLRIEYDIANRILTLDGEVGDIVAKRRAYATVSQVDGVEGIVDRLRVRPGEPRGDGAIRDSVTRTLLEEPVLRDCALHVHDNNGTTALRDPSGSTEAIRIKISDGVVELTGHVGSLSHKRLTGALAWWAPGCRDVLNEMSVEPPEADSDAEIADALRLVLEKDPLIPHADDLGLRVRNGIVKLSGVVATEEERRLAEYDAWYLSAVQDVVNEVEVRRAARRR